MQRRSFSREFKVEAVRLVRKRGVSVAQAARDLDVHENGSTQSSLRSSISYLCPKLADVADL